MHSNKNPGAVCCVALITVVLGTASISWAADPAPGSQTLQFDIKPQSLASALNAFALQSHQQILFTPEITKGKTTQGAHGALTSDAALRQLLVGTGLSSSKSADGMVLVTQADAKGASATSDPPIAPNGAPKDAIQTTPPRSSRDDRAAILEEVVVTAQKREERLLDTPLSVSVVSSEALAQLGATQFRDFADTVPGLSFQTFGAGFTQVTLRGVTTGSDVGQAVAIYVDEVPYGSSTAYAQAGQTALDVGLFDLNRIEVLRGPQGTLYGASSMGGLLKYVTKRPDASNWSSEVQSGVSGTDNGGVNYNVAGSVNMPLVSSTLGLRASAYESHDGGYIDNVVRDKTNVNRSNIYGGRLDFLLTPTDQLSFRITGFLQNISRDGEATGDYAYDGLPLYGRLNQARPFAEPFEQQFRLVSGTVSYEFGPATLTSISSYQNAATQIFYDVSPAFLGLANLYGSDPPYAGVGNPVDISLHKFTQEVRLAGQSNRPLEWLLGGFYTHEDTTNVQALELLKPSGVLAPNNLYNYSGPSTYQEGAAFADLTYHIVPQFDLTGGVRIARDHQSFEQIGGGLFGSSSPTNHSSESVTTWLANARYHFNEHAMAYVRFATGYRPGGPNFLANDPTTGRPIAASTFGADHLKSYESGFKIESSDGHYSADVAGYYIDWTNIQVTAVRDGFAVLTNIPGGAKIKGTELLLNARPIEGFSLSGAFAYQDARISQADTDLGATDGERLPTVPQVTATGSADYLWHVLHEPSVGATIRYVSNRDAAFSESTSRPEYFLPAYSAVDLRGGLKFGSLTTQLFVRNLFNQDGQISALFTQFATARVAVVQPRTVGVELTAQF